VIIGRARTFYEAKGKYQEIFLDFRKNFLPLSSEIEAAKNISDPATLVPLSQSIGDNFS
jgi:hypothetical protein